jgi:hypothetical protein
LLINREGIASLHVFNTVNKAFNTVCKKMVVGFSLLLVCNHCNCLDEEHLWQQVSSFQQVSFEHFRLIHIKDKERRERKDKNKGGGAKDMNKPNGNPE